MSQQLTPTGGTEQLLWQSASAEHGTEQTPPPPLLLLEELAELALLAELDELDPTEMPPPFPPFPVFSPPPPSPPPPEGWLPNWVVSPSAHAAKLSPQSPIARRRMLACFTGLCFEATRMPGCTQLPTLGVFDE
ncbi:MAG: hypothetical protein IPM54_43420 [Polyangiaceae bacterium]|nr:hypothetical protein [Polyangiaceae bacterium]